MPVVAKNESSIPMSATAYGLKAVRTIAAKPRLFSESAILRFDDAKLADVLGGIKSLIGLPDPNAQSPLQP